MKNDNLKKSLADLKKANSKADKFINEINKKIDVLDLEYAKTVVKADINNIKTAQEILKRD